MSMFKIIYLYDEKYRLAVYLNNFFLYVEAVDEKYRLAVHLKYFT